MFSQSNQALILKSIFTKTPQSLILQLCKVTHFQKSSLVPTPPEEQWPMSWITINSAIKFTQLWRCKQNAYCIFISFVALYQPLPLLMVEVNKILLTLRSCIKFDSLQIARFFISNLSSLRYSGVSLYKVVKI